MAYQLLYLPGARKDLLALPQEVSRRARRALEQLAQEPRFGKPLQGELAPLWSYGVGDYRIVYEIRDRELVIWVALVGHRREIYERARRRRL
jgi:mRNA interferase RelE/StbE